MPWSRATYNAPPTRTRRPSRSTNGLRDGGLTQGLRERSEQACATLGPPDASDQRRGAAARRSHQNSRALALGIDHLLSKPGLARARRSVRCSNVGDVVASDARTTRSCKLIGGPCGAGVLNGDVAGARESRRDALELHLISWWQRLGTEPKEPGVRLSRSVLGDTEHRDLIHPGPSRCTASQALASISAGTSLRLQMSTTTGHWWERTSRLTRLIMGRAAGPHGPRATPARRT